jgi:uncharacterized repeat protein (TIGR03803 family)
VEIIRNTDSDALGGVIGDGMRRITASFGALSIRAAMLLLVGCGGGSDTSFNPWPFGPPVDVTHTTKVYDMLYVFQNAPDGAEPYSDLIDVDGTLYGTTSIGGTNDAGSVFTLTTSGKEAILYSFMKAGSGDGAFPVAGLLKVNGRFYGTTRYGGAGTCYDSGPHQCGTVFTITTSGSETVLHRFGASSGDGTEPFAGLTDVKGTLFGTTSGGGSDGLGTVFSITTPGKETVLYSFKRARKDGANPYARLINVNGTLYGTTLYGGAYGDGTVFRVSARGKEHVLHSFRYAEDGANPYDGLLDVNGRLYGTTNSGGAHQVGTIFAITTSGTETLLYSFNDKAGDGADPVAGLANVKGTLYGTTVIGGKTNFGTVFAITTSGKERVLYRFRGGPGSGGSGDGSEPYASLLNVGGTLYGTTTIGGRSRYGFCCGTVFALTP